MNEQIYYVPKHTLTEWDAKYPDGTLRRTIPMDNRVCVKIVDTPNTDSTEKVDKK